MTVPLFELSVPIRTQGESEARGAFQRIEAAGKRAATTLEQTARQSAQKTAGHFSQMGSQYLRALNAETAKARPSLERQGQQLAMSLTAGLRRQLARQQAEIREELARGLITPQQAQQRGREAGLAFNRGVLQVINRQGAAGAFSGRQGGAVFVGLANQLRQVDQAGLRAGRGGLRSVTSGLASIIAMELGVRSGLGTMTSILGTLALGSGLMLGVTAGLAAIVFLFNRITKSARDAKNRIKEFQEEGLKLFQDLQRQTPEFLRDEATAQRVLAIDKERIATEKRAKANQLARLAETADFKVRSVMQQTARKAAEEASRAELDARQARLALQGRETAASDAELSALEKKEQAVISLIALGRKDASVLAERTKLEADLVQQLKATGLSLEDRAKLEERLNALRTAGVEKTKKAKKETDTEAQSLAALATIGLATAEDLQRLADIQVTLSAATQVGTADARAQAAALLETVRAARLANIELRLLRQGMSLAPQDPRLSKTTPPDTRPRRAPDTRLTDDQLKERGFNPAPAPFIEHDWASVAERMGIGDAEIGLFQQFRDILDESAMKVATLSVALDAGAQAWSAFWEGVGSGDMSGLGSIISGFAKQMSALFAAQAAAAFAMGITPPPLGNPMYLKSVPKLLAVSAMFGVLAGATSGRGGAGGGGGRVGSREDPLAERREMYQVEPRLRGPSFGVQASQVQPMQPVTFNGTFYGTDRDPKVHKWISDNVRAAQRRGYIG